MCLGQEDNADDIVQQSQDLWIELERALERESRASVLKEFKTSKANSEVPVGKCPRTIDQEIPLFHREGHPPCLNIEEPYVKQ